MLERAVCYDDRTRLFYDDDHYFYLYDTLICKRRSEDRIHFIIEGCIQCLLELYWFACRGRC